MLSCSRKSNVHPGNLSSLHLYFVEISTIIISAVYTRVKFLTNKIQYKVYLRILKKWHTTFKKEIVIKPRDAICECVHITQPRFLWSYDAKYDTVDWNSPSWKQISFLIRTTFANDRALSVFLVMTTYQFHGFPSD